MPPAPSLRTNRYRPAMTSPGALSEARCFGASDGSCASLSEVRNSVGRKSCGLESAIPCSPGSLATGSYVILARDRAEQAWYEPLTLVAAGSGPPGPNDLAGRSARRIFCHPALEDLPMSRRDLGGSSCSLAQV